MIKLFQPPVPGWGRTPSASPFCIKLEFFLRMSGIAFESARGSMVKAPKGKVPYIEIDGKLMGDSGHIIDHLKAMGLSRIDSHLTPREEAMGLAIRRMLEEHTYFCSVWMRWSNDVSFAEVQKVFMKMLPPVIGPLLMKKIRKTVMKMTLMQGVARHTPSEIESLAMADWKAVSKLLGNQLYILGEKPSSIDATVAAFAIAVLWTPWESALKDYVKQLSNIEPYVERMYAQYFLESAK